MERALDLELLIAALDGRTNLPTADELQQLMAQMEVQLFLQTSELPDQLLDAAWYLHGIAAVAQARDRYTPQRQRQAFLVSAHIFDLALNQPDWSHTERLSFGFAAAIGYRRGGRDPNATAIMNRLRDDIATEPPLLDHVGTLALEAGLAFLGFETRTLFQWFGAWRRQLDLIATASELPDLSTTVFGPTHLTVLGADDLLAFFARGNIRRLQRGRERLTRVAIGAAGPGDLNARWVAAHLLNLSDEAEAGSLWNPSLLPPDVPQLVRQAFTLGRPAVLTLWEPQRDLLAGPRSPLDPDVRRMVLAVPTSGGKTLLGQILSVEHIARTATSVCYVVPTRSLGREVRRAMGDRLRMLERETPPEPSDFPTIEDLFDSIENLDDPEVEVMTPERLAHLLRHDAPGVLNRFGMFIFDEAQLLKESGRGFILESNIAILDHLTRETDHRIVLISAAMGNAGTVAQWLSPDGQSLRYESQWRGPRRLHAAFTATARWDTTRVEENTRATTWPYRLVTDVTGLIRLRMANGHTSRLFMNDTGWQLVRKSTSSARRQYGLQVDGSRSTQQYRIASDMITALGHAGSVLIVANTRSLAQTLARGIADVRGEYPPAAPLVDFVRLQLGDDHPLVNVLRRGVGFHHAGLPIEVLEAIENAVRDDTLPFLTCTSTLTEGVNLPVRTVIIYDQQYADQPADARLRGARLVNAMGRAGRAGRETEGWIVLVRAAEPTEQDFHDLNPDADELAVTSCMTTDEALEAFAQFEEAQQANEDALFEAPASAESAHSVVDDFISFVWTFLAVEEERGTDPSDLDIAVIVNSTLAALQSPASRQRCLSIAASVRAVYARTDPQARTRWRRTGTSVRTARTLDRLGRNLADQLVELSNANKLGDLTEPKYVARLLRTFIDRLLEFSEAPKWGFRQSKQGASIDVAVADLLTRWLGGASLPRLAEEFLAAAPKPAWRIEQMVDAVTTLFEHYLAWTLGALIELTNLRLSELENELRLCPDLGAYVRYGVGDPAALVLMRSGVRSRRLAHAVSRQLPADFEPTVENLRAWLGGQGVGEWRSAYAATAPELLDLLDFTRLRRRSLLKALLESGQVHVDLTGPVAPTGGLLTLEPKRDEPSPAPLCVYTDEKVVATTAPHDHADLDAILNTGLEIVLTIEESDGATQLTITAAMPPDTAD
ncbi:DEAD/DEAH box helicase [Micromonospora sp. NBC_00858]|uniref:DEAD/DEAH box helicase n=1 Tax=Micromonospora sp. NBC_00858 TaxID=2975979 RepID=UPI003864C172|nr:DEAD/DEAH box helicase [Micromonospora sp. NBC_00858]